MAAWFAKKVEVLGHRFDSKAEADRAVGLYMLERAGKIKDLEFHPRFDLFVNGVKVGFYTADFSYWDVGKRCEVVEDVKPKNGYRTRDYVLRKKLMLACHGVEISEHVA